MLSRFPRGATPGFQANNSESLGKRNRAANISAANPDKTAEPAHFYQLQQQGVAL